jgi:hypothetical protein
MSWLSPLHFRFRSIGLRVHLDVCSLVYCLHLCILLVVLGST